MRKGFSVTLAMVAFAMLAYNVSAYAPTIDEIPDIVIGDVENSSAANVLVFPDAIDLNAKVHDDITSAAGIIWTYSESNTSGGVIYLINKATPSNPASDNLVSPAAAKRVDNQSDPVDSNGPRTATIRDNFRSPYTTNGGLGPYTPADCGGSTPTIRDSRVLTLYASDGSTVSLDEGESFIVYTGDNYTDQYSPNENVVFRFPAPGTQPAGWAFTQVNGVATGNGTSANGVCITVGATGNNDGQWKGVFGEIDLAANSCWEVRMTVTTDQTTTYHTPLWAVNYDNFGGASPNTGNNEYGGEVWFLDNEGGANSPIDGVGRTGTDNFRAWIMPVQQQTPQFSSATTGFYQPSVDLINDMRLILRVFDQDSGGYNANLDSGSVCWKNVYVVQHDLADKQVIQVNGQDNVYAVTQFTNGNTTAGGWQLQYMSGDASTVNFSTTAASVIPSGNWNGNSFLTFCPGPNTALDYGQPSTWAARYPVVWEANSLYYIEFMLSAADATAEADPPDFVRATYDEITNELLADHFCLPQTPDTSAGFTEARKRGLSTPRAAAPQAYACFFYTHSVTQSGLGVEAKRWRPRLDVMCQSNINPNYRTGNAHGINVNSMKIQKVQFAR